MKNVILFCVAFVIPSVYWRGLFYIFTKIFGKPFLRLKTGLQIHHGHYGIIMTFIAAVLLIFSIINVYVFFLLGLGLGFVFDEFIPSLLMPGNRQVELEIYQKSLKQTFILISLILIGLIGGALIYFKQ